MRVFCALIYPKRYCRLTRHLNVDLTLGYTKIGRDQYPGEYLKENISPDVAIFELRVNKKARVHGFRSGDIFYICFLDKEHRITGN